MDTSMRRGALAGMAGSAIGVLGAGTLFFLDPQVSEDRASYPLAVDAFRATELLWTLSHVLVLVGAVAFVRAGVAGRTRPVVVAGVAALIGFATQVVAEFSYIFFAEADVDDAGPMILSTAFGISQVLIGLGLVGLGIGVLRARRWSGWQRHAPLVWGIWSIAVIPLLAVGGLFFVGIVAWYAAGLLLWTAMLTAPAAVPEESATV